MDWLKEPMDALQWALLHGLAGILWALDRIFLIGGVQIHSMRKWITDPNGIITLALQQLLQGNAAGILKSYIAGAVMLALLLVVMWYFLRAFVGNANPPASLGKIIAWLVITGTLFSQGPALAGEIEQFRASMSSGAYQVAGAVNGSVNGSGYNNTHGEVPNTGSEPFGTLTTLFPNTTHVYQSGGTPEYTGIDIAAAYLLATQDDINGVANGGTGLPGGLEKAYYCNPRPEDCQQPWPSGADDGARKAALTKALNGVIRAGSGIVPALFADLQAIIFLALAIAAAILLISLPITLMFAFFTSTEVIALSVVRAYIGLLIKTYVTSMILALFMGFLVYWGAGNWVAFLGMSVLTLYFTLQLTSMAVQTITQSLNVVTQAIGQATGTKMAQVDPVGMMGNLAGLALTAGAAVATGGTSLAAGSLLTGAAKLGLPGAEQIEAGRSYADQRILRDQQEDLRLAQTAQATAIGGAVDAGAPIVALNLAHSRRMQDGEVDAAGDIDPDEADARRRRTTVNNYLRSKGLPEIPAADAVTTPLPVGRNAAQGSIAPPNGYSGYSNGAAPSAPTEALQPDLIANGTRNGVAPSVPLVALQPTLADNTPVPLPLAVRPDWGRAVGPALVDLVRTKPTTAADLPALLQQLPATNQAALLALAQRGYAPLEVATVTGAVQAEVNAALHSGRSTVAVAANFLDPTGRISLDSPAVQGVIDRAGSRAGTFAGSAARNADLVQLIGASLGLVQSQDRPIIRSVVATAAAAGGTADSAAAALGMAPAAAWASRYGAVDNVIRQAATYGLNDSTRMESFIHLAQQHQIGDLLNEQAELSDEQAQLLREVREQAQQQSILQGTGTEGGDHLLTAYMRDVRAIPTRITGPVVPLADVTGAVERSVITPSAPALVGSHQAYQVGATYADQADQGTSRNGRQDSGQARQEEEIR